MQVINQVVLPIGIMIAITKARDIYSFVNGKSKPVNSVVEWAVFIAMVVYFILGLLPRHNIFKELGIKIDTPSFIIKQKMMVYTGPELDLIGFLSTDIGRQIYYSCGNIDCHWCVDKYDYTTFTLPFILFPHVVFLVFAGVCTFDRPTVRTLTMFGTMIAVMVEIVLLGYDGLLDIPFEETQYNLFSRIRCFVFSLYFALLFLIKPKLGTNDQLTNLIQLTNETRLLGVKRETIELVQSDAIIQAQWNKYQTSKQQQEKLLAKDPEIRRKRDDLRITRDIEKIKNETRALVGQLFGEDEHEDFDIWE
ncbi:hypothetical protein HDV01_000281 [Terramyces sp. JEL0728]|nr:hypothetical protein HDV01_000281 [Terramyces sp. JEL0728]